VRPNKQPQVLHRNEWKVRPATFSCFLATYTSSSSLVTRAGLALNGAGVPRGRRALCVAERWRAR
jgi:hypothetical protein